MNERLSPNESKHYTDVSAEAAKRAAELGHNNKESGNQNQAERAEIARKEAMEAAISGAEKPAEQIEEDIIPPVGTKKQRQQSFKHTLKATQKQMNPAERAFSKVIHTPIIEKSSELIGSTIARPNSIVSGALCAFLLVLTLYMLARYYGFSLQGSETILAFAAGWVIGIAFDAVRSTLRNRR